MERLTKRTVGGVANLKYANCFFKNGQKDQIAASAYRQAAFEKLADYEDAEEQEGLKMDDYAALCEELHNYTYWIGQSGNESRDIHPSIVDRAASAIESLQNENEQLKKRNEHLEKENASREQASIEEHSELHYWRDRARRMEKERDAAVRDMCHIAAKIEQCTLKLSGANGLVNNLHLGRCSVCNNNISCNEDASCCFEWRGIED